MRLDKLLAELNIGTRSQVKEFLRQKLVTVNGEVVTRPECKVDPKADQISFRGTPFFYEPFQYYLLNKPGGVVSATRDRLSDTVISLLPQEARRDLFPVGRLDKDTEGLLLLTNDGELAHRLLSPKKHVSKTYLALLEKPLSESDRQLLEEGVDIGEEEKTLPAQAILLNDKKDGIWLRLTITEGRYHQVKRMLEAVGNRVLYLKRIRFGPLSLDKDLSEGACRAMTLEEISALKNAGAIREEKHGLIEGKKAVIFDLDGSLVDSMWIWPAIDCEYLARFGFHVPVVSKERDAIRRAIEGKSFHETAIYFKENFGLPDSIEKMKEDWNQMAWDKYENEVPLKDGVLEFLENCKKRGILLGIASSNSRELVENVLKAHGVREFFSVIATGSEITKGKPAPDIYLHVAERLGVDPSDCLVFEDIVPGIQAGKSAGMTVCAVADQDSECFLEEKKAAADAFIEDFYDFFL